MQHVQSLVCRMPCTHVQLAHVRVVHVHATCNRRKLQPLQPGCNWALCLQAATLVPTFQR
jgi:hypothetical protein